MTKPENIFEEITLAIQKIQDNVIQGTKGLDRTEVKEHIVFWELGLLLKKFIDSKSIPLDNVHDELEKNFRKIEKKIRSDGKRKDMDSLPSWLYKNQTVKPPRMQEPAKTWVLVCWEFVLHYKDLERWNLVAELSGYKFNECFVRKRAEDFIPYFSKQIPPKNADRLQDKFIKEFSKYNSNPSRKQLGLDTSLEGLIPNIFGKSKININLASDYFFRIQTDVRLLLESETGTQESRNDFSKNIGIDVIDTFRRVIRLVSITDEQKFEKRYNQISKQLPKSIKTKHVEVKDLYRILYSMLKESNSRSKFLILVSRIDLIQFNTKLAATVSSDAFDEYQENQRLKQELFS